MTLNKFVVYKYLIRRIYLESTYIIKTLIFKVFVISSNNWVTFVIRIIVRLPY